jgi:predicted oxidoreductase
MNPDQTPALHLSPIVAGLWRMQEWGLDTAGALRWIEQAVDLGITSFDHADIYGGYGVEAFFGAALGRAPALRQRLQLVTKCGIKLTHPSRPAHTINSYDSSRTHVVSSVEQSLRALGTDHIDLLLMHRPDLLMDPDELADTFRQLRAAGKVLHFGVSNHSPGQLAMLHKRHPVSTNQIEFSPLQLQALADGTLEQCVDIGMRPMIWSPLGRGRLFDNGDEQARRVHAVLGELAQAQAVSVATMAFAWILRHPSRPWPVTGTGRQQGLQEAVAALQVKMSAQDWYRVWQASKGHAVP